MHHCRDLGPGDFSWPAPGTQAGDQTHAKRSHDSPTASVDNDDVFWQAQISLHSDGRMTIVGELNPMDPRSA